MELMPLTGTKSEDLNDFPEYYYTVNHFAGYCKVGQLSLILQNKWINKTDSDKYSKKNFFDDLILGTDGQCI